MHAVKWAQVFPLDCSGVELELLSPEKPNAFGVHKMCWLSRNHPDFKDKGRTRWPLLRAMCALRNATSATGRERSRSRSPPAFLQLPHSFHMLPVILCISAFAATTTATRSSEAEAALVPELPDNRVTQDCDLTAGASALEALQHCFGETGKVSVLGEGGEVAIFFDSTLIQIQKAFLALTFSEHKITDENFITILSVDEAHERTNILVNFWIEDGADSQLAEVQFLMQDFLTAKELQHMYYDVTRAGDFHEIGSKPLFRPIPD
eukprot:s9265_g1.t2